MCWKWFFFHKPLKQFYFGVGITVYSLSLACKTQDHDPLLALGLASTTGTPGPCFQFSVESELLIYFCYFVCIILVILPALLCVCGLCPWITFDSARILVPLIIDYSFASSVVPNYLLGILVLKIFFWWWQFQVRVHCVQL